MSYYIKNNLLKYKYLKIFSLDTLMDTLDTKKEQFLKTFFCCKKCYYKTSKKCNYNRHFF